MQPRKPAPRAAAPSSSEEDDDEETDDDDSDGEDEETDSDEQPAQPAARRPPLAPGAVPRACASLAHHLFLTGLSSTAPCLLMSCALWSLQLEWLWCLLVKPTAQPPAVACYSPRTTLPVAAVATVRTELCVKFRDRMLCRPVVDGDVDPEQARKDLERLNMIREKRCGV